MGLVWCLVSFTAISSDFFREGAVAFALYFQFSDEIGTDQRALILLSVLARHRALRRMAAVQLCSEYAVSSGMAFKAWKS